MDRELLEYFKGEELSSSVWKSKYSAEGEITPDDMHRRMAEEFARANQRYPKVTESQREKLSEFGKKYLKHLTEEEIFQLFKDFKYIIPQGSIMATLGTDHIASLSNCWVVQSPLDSYSSILKADSDLVNYYRRRGGCGVDISNLRPRGAATNNTAKASTGAVSFTHRFSHTTREVAMEGRRGALMITLDINHPDCMEFITIKRDSTSVTGANISLRLNQEFKKAIDEDKDYLLRFPCDLDVSHLDPQDFEYEVLTPLEGEHRYVKRIKARHYWEEIIKSARDYAEPGLLYWDNAMEYDPSGVYPQYKPVSTNPCGEQALPPEDSCRLIAHRLDSYVKNPFTSEAYFDKDLFYKHAYYGMILGDDLVNLEAEYIQRIIDKIEKDDQPSELKVNELNLWKNSWRMCQEARRSGLGITALGDTLAMLGVKYGSKESLAVISDIMKTKMQAELDCNIDLAIVRGPFTGWNPNLESNSFYSMLKEEFPEAYKRMQEHGRRSLSFSTIAPTGCSRGDSLVTTNKGFLLLNELGNTKIGGFSNLYEKQLIVNQDTSHGLATMFFNNGLAKTKKITLNSGLELESTLNHQYKILRKDDKNRFSYYWEKVENLKKGDLMVYSLGGYYHKNSFTDEHTQKYFELLGIILFSNPLVTSDKDKLTFTVYNGEKHRKTLELCTALGVDMEQVSSQELTISIMDQPVIKVILKDLCLEKDNIPHFVRTSSAENILSFLKGASQEYSEINIETTNKSFAQQLLVIMRGLGINAEIITYSRGNIQSWIHTIRETSFMPEKYKEALVELRSYGENLYVDSVSFLEDSQCPTFDIEVPNKNMYLLNSVVSHNTVSLMADNCTSGCEPLFQPYYMRRKKINPGDKDSRVDFIDDVGDSWQEYPVIHPRFKEWMILKGYEDFSKDTLSKAFSESPWFRATANELDPESRIDVLSVLQKYTSNSISSTINLPKTVTYQDVSKVYMKGWNVGLKGNTVYVDQSRSGVLITEGSSKKDEFSYTDAAKRPKSLNASALVTTVKGNKYMVLIGFLDNRPYEVFALPVGDEFPNFSSGQIVRKNRKSYYYVTDSFRIDNLQDGNITPEEQILTRLISALLRHRANPKYIIEQINKCPIEIVSFGKAISRVLKNFIKEDEKFKAEQCPECGENTLIYSEGCKKCACGYSAC